MDVVGVMAAYLSVVRVCIAQSRECLSRLFNTHTHHGTPNLSNYSKYAAITPTTSISTDKIEPLL